MNPGRLGSILLTKFHRRDKSTYHYHDFILTVEGEALMPMSHHYFVTTETGGLRCFDLNKWVSIIGGLDHEAGDAAFFCSGRNAPEASKARVHISDISGSCFDILRRNIAAATWTKVFEVSNRGTIAPKQKGVGITVTAGATSLLVTLPEAEPDASYGVLVVPSWNTTVWVTNKTTSGFTVNFGTAPTADSPIDYFIYR